MISIPALVHNVMGSNTRRPKEYFSEQKILIGKLCISTGTQNYRSQGAIIICKNTSCVINNEN